MIVAAYARFSTDRQRETSIEAQLSAISGYCAREGHELLPDPYIDMGQTGTNTGRGGFQRLLQDARARRFEAICVYDVSRGSRNVADWFGFRREMEDLGVRVLSVTEQLGSMDDPADFLRELITVGIGQHMVLQTRQKSIAGKRVRAAKGLFCGGIAPLGYKIEDGHYVIVPEEARVVREIYSLYCAGCSYGEIIARLEPRGRYGGRMKANSIHDVLRNPRYTGRFVWFEHEEQHMRKRVWRSGDMMEIPDAIPRIIDDATWTEVQNRMDNKSLKPARKNTYLLSGLIRCGECGRAMYGATITAKGHTYVRYICSGKRDPEIRCEARNCNAADVDGYIARCLRDYYLRDDMIEEVARQYLASRRPLEMDPRTELERELQLVQQRLDRCVTLLLDTDTPDEALKVRLRDLEAHKADLRARLAAVAPAPALALGDVIAAMRQDAARLLADPDALRRIVSRYVEQVVVFDASIEVTWRLPSTPIDDGGDNASGGGGSGTGFNSSGSVDPQKQKKTTTATDCGGCNSYGSPGAEVVLFKTVLRRK